MTPRHGARMLTLIAAMTLVACQANLSQSSRLTTGDVRTIVDETIEALAVSDFITSRDADSDPCVITVTRVENNSSDVITRSEQWYLMQSVANAVFERGLREERNVTVVIPAERLREARRRATISDRAGVDRNPTHVMTAIISSITRSGDDQRQDFYQAEYKIVDLASREEVWSDIVEFERQALGRSYN